LAPSPSTLPPPYSRAPLRGPPARQVGLDAISHAIASWQVVCNITRPKAKASRCCVSFSAFYNDSVAKIKRTAFDNRTAKAKAWAKIKHRKVPHTLPCGDFCGVSINWHVNSDYRKGWTARITIFNWEDYTFQNWFAAIQIKKAYRGYENVYSFNGTKLPELNNTIFFEGLPGLNYLMPISSENDPSSQARVPSKQQSVISFTKKQTPGINIWKGDGFPTRVYFNGEECALPSEKPKASGHSFGIVGASALQIARDHVILEVRKHFRPKLLNRLDEIVIFDPLSHEQLRKVARLQMKDVAPRLAERGIALAVTDAEVYGARPVRRWLEKRVVTQLSKMLTREDIDENSTVYIDAVAGMNELLYMVTRNGGLVDNTTGHKSNILIELPNGHNRNDTAQSVKKMKIVPDEDDDDDMP
ncbi:hypothetical protein Taro_049867, partial [Colocasia esculenta]|nr:hypothetical protein [Colocasia esculenta]